MNRFVGPYVHVVTEVWKHTALSVMCLLVFGEATLAADSAVTTAMPERDASDSNGVHPSDDDDAIDEVIVYGWQRPAMDVITGASTTRVETDERLVEGARIDDLLAEMPGVQIRRFGGVGERFDISIRGSRPEQVPVYLDGFRLDTPLTGRSDLSTLCLDLLDEIQVTRGPGAARSGSGAIGGVVNLVSRRPREDPETRVRVGAGNFSSFEGSLRHSRRWGPWDLAIGYCGFRTEGDFKYQQIGAEINGQPTVETPTLRRINNEAERHTGLTQAGRKMGDGRLRLIQFITALERGEPGPAIAGTQRAFAEEEDLGTLSSLGFDHPLGIVPKGRVDLGLAHRYERNRFEDPVAFGLSADPINARTEVHGVVGNGSLRSQISRWGGTQVMTMLVEGRYDYRGSNEAESESRRSIAFRTEVESRWFKDRLRITPSLRLERYSGFDLEWLPSLAAQAELHDLLVIRGSISRSYRVPSFRELYMPDKGFESGNPDLNPEEAWSFEVGGTLRSPFESAWLDFEIEGVYFESQIDESIVFQLVSPTRFSFVNTGGGDTWGYELTARWRPHNWVRVTASRTVTHARLDSSGCPIAGIASSQTDGRLELGPRKRFKLVGEIHYTGRIFLDSGCAAFLPSRISYDASAALDVTKLPMPLVDRLGKSLWLSVRGRNLGNVSQYDTSASPQPGRNFSVAIEGVF